MEGLSSLLCVILGDRCQNMWFVLHNFVLDCQQRSLVAKMFVGGDHWPRKNDDRHQISRFVDAGFGNRGCKSCKIKCCGLSCGFHICDIKIFELQFFRIDFHKTEAISCSRYESVFFVLQISNLETDLQLWQKQCCGGLVVEVKALLAVVEISATKWQYCFNFNALEVSIGTISCRHGKYICAAFPSVLGFYLDSGNYCGAKKNFCHRAPANALAQGCLRLSHSI